MAQSNSTARINELAEALLASWPRGTISLNCHRDGRRFSVWLHHGSAACLWASGDTADEALSAALANAASTWPDLATVRRQALKDAKIALARAKADVAALEAEAA